MSTAVMDSASSFASSGSAKALSKGLRLVDAVVEHGAPMRLTDLVSTSGLPRPTALRLLDVLCRGEVLRLDDRGSYALGPRVAVWGHAFLDGLELRSMAADLMQAVVESTNETCFLGALHDGRVLYIAAADGPQAVRPAARVGFRNPLHCTAIGKALLAHLPGHEAENFMAGPLEQRTPNTLTETARLREELARTRDRGYAIDDVENEDGVRCIAAPVYDHKGAVVAGMSISAPAYRFSLEDLAALAPLITRVTFQLSRRLGFKHSTTARKDHMNIVEEAR